MQSIITQTQFKFEAMSNSGVPLTTIYCENNAPYSRLQWTKVSVPFEKGRFLNAQDLDAYGVEHGYFEWKVIKWHFENGAKHSIAIAQLKFVAFFSGVGATAVPIVPATKLALSFELHPSLEAYLNEFFGSLIAKVKIAGDTKEYVAFPFNSENIKIMSAGSTGLVYRSRTQIRSQTLQGVTVGTLSCTAYMEVNWQDPIIRTTIVFGNDTVETAVPNGIPLESIRLESSPKLSIKPIMPTAYGITNFNDHMIELVRPQTAFTLADGQTTSFRFNAFVQADTQAPQISDIMYSSFLAETMDPMLPSVEYSSFEASKALNSYQSIPRVRFTDKAGSKAMAEASRGAPFVVSNAISYLGNINLNPGATGSQPDFASTVPPSILEGLQVNSQKLLNKVLMSVDRESFRPSYYWKTTGGYTDRIQPTLYPNLFFWSSHPHWDFSWNNAYSDWRSRTGGFQGGSYSGWNGHDNQHLSNNHLRTMYELTGDAYLQDICEYYISIIYFNFFTRWFTHAEAERCNRTMKEGLMHACLFPDNPHAQLLVTKIQEKMTTVYKTNCEMNMSRFASNIAAVAPFDACDPRVAGGAHCPATPPNDIMAVGWMTGFHMEFLNLMLEMGFATAGAMRLAQYYQNSIDYYFQANGAPNTYTLLTNPSITYQGGIGIRWWAGWCNISKHFPANPRIEALKTLIKADFGTSPGYFVSHGDGFNSF